MMIPETPNVNQAEAVKGNQWGTNGVSHIWARLAISMVLGKYRVTDSALPPGTVIRQPEDEVVMGRG